MTRFFVFVVILQLFIVNSVLAEDTFKLKQTMGKDGVTVYWVRSFGNDNRWTAFVLSPTKQTWLLPGVGYSFKFGYGAVMPVFYLEFDTTRKHLPISDLVPDLFISLKYGNWKGQIRNKLEIDPRGKDETLLFGRDYLERQFSAISFGIQDEYSYSSGNFKLYLGFRSGLKLTKVVSLVSFCGVSPKHSHSKKIWLELKVKL